MGDLFDRRYVYPSDREGGCYVEFEGAITRVEDLLAPVYHVWVQTERGEFDGFTSALSERTPVPKAGWFATIRIYDIGGGWYPDNRIMSWGATPWPKPERGQRK